MRYTLGNTTSYLTPSGFSPQVNVVIVPHKMEHIYCACNIFRKITVDISVSSRHENLMIEVLFVDNLILLQSSSRRDEARVVETPLIIKLSAKISVVSFSCWCSRRHSKPIIAS